MCEKRWFVLNLNAPTDLSLKEDFLVKVFRDTISKFRYSVDSWHFLWEASPYPNTLLLRFYGEIKVINELEEDFEEFLTEEGIEYTLVETYGGEVPSYGVKGWEYVMRILHLGSDFVLDLIQKERSEAGNEDLSKPLFIYIDRWMHLFLNQLLTRVVEHDVLVQFSVHRYAMSRIGAGNYRQVAEELGKETPEFLNVFRESIDNFLRKIGYRV